MQYMGDYPAKKMTPYMQVWYIIDVGMNVDAMCDEVFAQVIKQTVENKSRKP